MVVENTQQPESVGKPPAAVSRDGSPDNDWLPGDSTHKELMRLEDREKPLSASGSVVPTPPGDTNVPPPGKGAKSAGTETSNSQTQGGNSQTQQGKSQAPESKPGQPPQDAKSGPNGGAKSEPGADKAAAPVPRPVSEAKVKMKERLPALYDDGDIGKDKEQTVAREGKADLGFTGTLLGSAASSAPKGEWQELRVYSTSTGKHVFSKVMRTVYADENDKHQADVFDPSPTSVSSQLLRTARELAKSRPMTWKDAAVAFFGYDALAKVLYRKLSVDFEERV